MINLKELHTDDLSMNSGKLFREQMIENFKAIQRGEIDSEEQDRKSEDNKLNGRIDATNTRLDNLDKQKATHDEVKELHDELLLRIKHIYLGTDKQAIRDVILQMKEKGEILSYVIGKDQRKLTPFEMHEGSEFDLNKDPAVTKNKVQAMQYNSGMDEIFLNLFEEETDSNGKHIPFDMSGANVSTPI